MDLSAAPPHPAGSESGRDAPAGEALILLEEIPDLPPLVDTLRAARRLENAGFGSVHAEAIVTIVAHAGTRLATKEDIERLEASTKKDIQNLRTELTARMDTKIAELRVEMNAMMNRQAVVFVAVAGLLFAALRWT